MLHALLKLIHVLSVILWVGGMAFVLAFLRPAVATLEPATRVRLMHDVLRRFLKALLFAVILVLATGVAMVGLAASQAAAAGGGFRMPASWSAMGGLGVLMAAIFGHVRMAPYRRLERAMASADWPAAGAALGGIRRWVLVNLALGVLVVAIVLLG